MRCVEQETPRVRVAAVGDVHASELERERLTALLQDAARAADVILLAGDLTAHGEPREASVLADASRALETPVVAVLGNHDWHSDRVPDIVGVLTEAGVVVLERSTTIVPVRDVTVGIAGVKGFVGGFASPWANFGERLFRDAYAETTADVEALGAGLRAIAACTLKIVLLHYAPIWETLVGEPEQLWLVLGTERLARPIDEHRPDLVLHGHAHAGTFAGSIGAVPVYNVAQPVLGQDFWIFELEPAARQAPRATVEVKPG